MKTKTLTIPTAIVLGTITVAISLAVFNTPISKLVPQLTKTEQRKVEDKWQHTADVYETTWNYVTPSTQDKIGFVLTLSGGIIQNVEVKVYTKSKDSIVYQTNFGKALPKLVIGKKLSEIASLDTVSGASGTTKNFKAAVASLSQQLED